MNQFSRSSLIRNLRRGVVSSYLYETFWTGQIRNNFGTGSCSGSGTSTGFDIFLPIKSCPYKAILYLIGSGSGMNYSGITASWPITVLNLRKTN